MAVPKVPSPWPANTLTLLLPLLAVMTSGLPSPLVSVTSSATGAAPTA